MTNLSPDARPDVDGLLRATLADDLPTAVEDRLNARVERFLAERRRPAGGGLVSIANRFARVLRRPAMSAAGLVLRAAGSAAVIVCGIALHGLGGPQLFAASVVRVQESVALWRAIDQATSMQCADAARDDLRSPAEFADRVYRRWVLVASRSDHTGALVLMFKSPDDFAQYEVYVDRRSMLPSRVVKSLLDRATPSRGSVAGYDAGCRWRNAATTGADQ